jgi:hypothetical protein
MKSTPSVPPKIRDGLAGRADRLHDVVFQDRGFAELLEDRDREHRDRNGGRDGQPGAQGEVDGRGAEEDSRG